MNLQGPSKVHTELFCCFEKRLRPHHDWLASLQTSGGQTPEPGLTLLSILGELLSYINWGLINVSEERPSDFHVG